MQKKPPKFRITPPDNEPHPANMSRGGDVGQWRTINGHHVFIAGKTGAAQKGHIQPAEHAMKTTINHTPNMLYGVGRHGHPQGTGKKENFLPAQIPKAHKPLVDKFIQLRGHPFTTDRRFHSLHGTHVR